MAADECCELLQPALAEITEADRAVAARYPWHAAGAGNSVAGAAALPSGARKRAAEESGQGEE